LKPHVIARREEKRWKTIGPERLGYVTGCAIAPSDAQSRKTQPSSFSALRVEAAPDSIGVFGSQRMAGFMRADQVSSLDLAHTRRPDRTFFRA
jgi:hypothetical protein